MHDDVMQVVVVPRPSRAPSPRRCNYGLSSRRGEFVTIYDAEDRPDLLQLRRAVVAFGRVPEEVGCLQAQLAYWNTVRTCSPRWFTVEYLQWFELLLPGLAAYARRSRSAARRTTSAGRCSTRSARGTRTT